MPKFQYHKRDASTMRKRSEQWGNDRDSFLKDHVPVWKPSDGANTIRILPPSWDGAEHFGVDIYVHYSIGADNSAYLDLTKMLKEPDPITEEVNRLRQEGDIEAAKELDSKKRILVYLVDRDKPKDGVMMWAMPWTVDKEIGNQCYDQRTKEALLVDSPEDGYDIIITKSGGKGKFTEYSVKIDRKSSVLKMTPEMEELLEEFPLPKCLNFFSYEHIQKAFMGGKRGADGGEEKKSSSPARESTRHGAESSKTPEFNVDELTWDDIQAMPARKLDRLFQFMTAEGYELDEYATSEDDLRESICEALSLPKPSNKRKPAPPARRAPAKEEEVSDEDDDVPFDGEDDSDKEEEPPPRRSAKTEEQEESEATSKAAALKSRLANLRNRPSK